MQTVQSRLEQIYGISVGESAADYLIEKNAVSELLKNAEVHNLPRELFLVNPNPVEDTLEIALYLNEALTANLANHSPLENLGSHNINDFCTLIEGVSHFVYYLHKMGLEHNVSQLELELQAEIDKFVLLGIFTESNGLSRQELMGLLFEDYYLHQHLTDEQVNRYESATGLAKQFCYKLSKNISRHDMTPLLAELRQFYSLPQDEKIRLIVQ